MDNANATSLEGKVAPAAILTAAVGSDVDDLKKAILFRWGQSEKELGPLFWKLRSKLKAQGKKGQGFGTWLDAHGIPRTTADRWANNYEVGIGLRPAKKTSLTLATSHTSEQSTFPQAAKGATESDGNVLNTGAYIERIILAFSKEQRQEFEKAEQKLRTVFGTDNVTDTVYALVMERATALLVSASQTEQEVR